MANVVKVVKEMSSIVKKLEEKVKKDNIEISQKLGEIRKKIKMKREFRSLTISSGVANQDEIFRSLTATIVVTSQDRNISVRFG